MQLFRLWRWLPLLRKSNEAIRRSLVISTDSTTFPYDSAPLVGHPPTTSRLATFVGSTIIQILILLFSLLHPRSSCAQFNYRQVVQLMCDVRCVCSAATHFQLLLNVFLRRSTSFDYLRTWTLTAVTFTPFGDGVELVGHSRHPPLSFRLPSKPWNLNFDAKNLRG